MTRKIASLLFIICIAITACNLPSGAPTEAPAGDSSPTPTAAVAVSDTPTATAAPAATACSPIVTTTTDANVRSGPGQVYNILGAIPLGGTAPVAGRNAEGTWWYIQFAAGSGGHAWIAGSVTTATCIPNDLAIIAAPPTPVFTPTHTLAPTSTPTVTPTFGLIIVLPPIIIIPSATPTLGFIFPVFPTICFPLGGC
jgi:hypothetical protein